MVANSQIPPTTTEIVELMENLALLWEEATGEERQRLISPLIERAYVDLEQKLIGAIVPTPAFRGLLYCAVRKSDADIIVASQKELEELGVWSWWRRGGIHLPQLQTRKIIVPHDIDPNWGAFAVGWAA